MADIFHIKKLNCTYGVEKPSVLEINDLRIQQEELIFFLGASGVGKSTLIESLGLMTNTIKNSKNNDVRYNSADHGQINLVKQWDKSSVELSKFRSKEFSFIFQTTNLFESVSLIDNIILPSFVENLDAARENAERLLKIFLPKINDYHTRLAGDLSGGQKQRLAFVRALIAESTVLFCDEPTGNLDVGNAKLVLRHLQQTIKENKSTALIVSHDVRLAVQFASRIILMTKVKRPDGTSYGSITSDNQFIKTDNNNWKYSDSEISNDQLIKKLVEHFDNTIEDE
ncbi:MAG: hypothetical protein CL847_05650 [Crocinitomicaceae bacterium]|nr:hypothetical protein [Crocinitomicaceae bacterium]|tara:strand:+ start:1460 stop:2311 length:852 start_codon:yes stop_codon:yes gene_type:complete